MILFYMVAMGHHACVQLRFLVFERADVAFPSNLLLCKIFVFRSFLLKITSDILSFQSLFLKIVLFLNWDGAVLEIIWITNSSDHRRV